MTQGVKLETMGRCYRIGSHKVLATLSLAFQTGIDGSPLGRSVAGKTQTLDVYLDKIFHDICKPSIYFWMLHKGICKIPNLKEDPISWPLDSECNIVN